MTAEEIKRGYDRLGYQEITSALCDVVSAQQRQIDELTKRMDGKDTPAQPATQPFPKDAVVVFRDGDQWCATGIDFVSLQESEARFGLTPDNAVAAFEWDRYHKTTKHHINADESCSTCGGECKQQYPAAPPLETPLINPNEDADTFARRWRHMTPIATARHLAISIDGIQKQVNGLRQDFNATHTPATPPLAPPIVTLPPGVDEYVAKVTATPSEWAMQQSREQTIGFWEYPPEENRRRIATALDAAYARGHAAGVKEEREACAKTIASLSWIGNDRDHIVNIIRDRSAAEGTKP